MILPGCNLLDLYAQLSLPILRKLELNSAVGVICFYKQLSEGQGHQLK